LRKKIELNFPDKDELRNVTKLMNERFISTVIKIEEYIERTTDGKLKSNAVIDRICDEFKKLKNVKNADTPVLEESILKEVAMKLLSTDEKKGHFGFQECAIGLVLYVFEKCDI